MSEQNAQQYLFQRIKEMLRPDQSLVSAVAEVLHLSEDSSYRRIRGETPLVLEEAKELCSHYRISLDQLFRLNNHSTVFETIRIHNQFFTFEAFLKDIGGRLEMISRLKGKHIYYLTKDIPLFHHFTFKPLFAFRYFFWMKSILQHPDFLNRKFTSDCLPAEVEQLGNGLLKIYNEIPSTEIWNTEGINSLILQLEYYREAGFFSNPDDLANIYEAVGHTIDHLQMQAEYGRKFKVSENPHLKPENFSFFYNRIILGDNTILIISEETKIAVLNFEVLNFMLTSDEAFCNQTYEGLNNLMRRSTMISQVSEKQRNIFFNILRAKVNDRIKSLN